MLLWVKRRFYLVQCWIRDMKLKHKIIIIYVICGLIPQFVLAFTLINGTRNIVITQTRESEDTELQAMSVRIAEIMRIISDVSLRMYFDKDLETIAHKKYNDYYENISDYYNFDTIKNYTDYYGREIQSIRLYIDNETIANNSVFVKVNDEIRMYDWYKESIEKKGKGIWRYLYNNITKENYLTLTREIRTKNMEHVAVVSIAVKNHQIDSLIQIREKETVVVLNDSELIATNHRDTDENYIIKLLQEYRNNTNHTNDMVIYKNQEYLMTVSDIHYSKTDSFGTIISLQPYEDILKSANNKAMEGLVFILVSLILSACFLILFSHKLTKRVMIFHNQMHRAANGDFDMSVKIYGRDEIGELYDDLCIMIHSIQNLIDTVYSETIQKEKLNSRQKEVEFKMLASQINPHFLYNTLETIRMKARCNDEYEIEEIVKMLAKIMRRNIEVGEKLVSLKSELSLVDYYLKIQKYRFATRISYRIDILCDIEKYRILPLIIQPIVENAFIHGLESKESHGEIIVSITEEDYLYIVVEDNGVGMELRRLEELEEALKNTEQIDRSSIGISNVNQRIKLLYGKEYGIKIESKAGVGTKVIIQLPKELGLYDLGQ